MNKKDAYSKYKPIHHLEDVKNIKKGEIINPKFVQWDLTTVCNLNCSFCFYKSVGYDLKDFDEKQVMPYAVVVDILNELKDMGVKAVEWTGGGEPTLHPNFVEIVLKAHDMGFEQALVTNGVYMKPELMDNINKFEWVRISVDAYRGTTYEKVKGTDRLTVVDGHIAEIVEKKDDNMILGLSYIVCKDNYKEVADFAKAASEIGVDNVRFSLAMTPEGEKHFEGIWDECVEQIERAKTYTNKDFTVFSFSNRINDLSGERVSDFCFYHHLVSVIAPEGVYPCCRLKYEPEFNFGNPSELSFKEIWNGTKRKDFICNIKNGCPYPCWMTEKNEFMSYMVSDNPRHVNFV